MIPLLNEALGYNIYRVNLLFRRELIQALSNYGITPEQWQIQSLLWASEDPLNQREIVQDTLKDKHTVSRIINRMVRDGWVTKTVSTKDKRVTKIALTEKSRSLREEMLKTLSTHFKSIFEQFGMEEHSTLLNLLKKLRKILGDNSK